MQPSKYTLNIKDKLIKRVYCEFNSIAIFLISVTEASATAFHDGKTSLARVSKFAANCQQMLGGKKRNPVWYFNF